jgi:hypothetical protein
MESVSSWAREHRLILAIIFGSLSAAMLYRKYLQEKHASIARGLAVEGTSRHAEAAPPSKSSSRRAVQLVEDNAEDHVDMSFERFFGDYWDILS